MAPSLLSTLSSALLLGSSVSATQSYQLTDSYDPTNFLEKFGLFASDYSTGDYNNVDPTGGYVNYQSAEQAQAQGLLKNVNGELYVGVDSTTTLDPAGVGRSSVRLESKTKYKKGLFVADFSHLPKPVCGAWPAFWTVGNPWPAAGEIDIYETWNEDGVNKVVIHTDSDVGECRIDGAGMTGIAQTTNCANFAPGQSDNQGCSGHDPAAPFGSADSGVYAMEWTGTSVKVWGFTHANAPADIATNPDPGTWGAPSFTTSVCDADKVFGEAKMVLNIDFCSVNTAGNEVLWEQGGCRAKAGGATCNQWVASNPQAFADVYFQLKSVKVWQLRDGEANATASATQIASSAAVSTAVPTDIVAPGTAVASEKPVATATGSGAVVPSVTAPADPVEVPVEDLTTRLATSTVYETNVKTITSCAPAVTNCPARETPQVVTEVVPVTTTVCPVVDVPTTMTVSKTEVHTITSCAPTVTNCPVGSQTTITKEEVVSTTAAVPVESYTKPAAGTTTQAEKKPVVTEQPPVGKMTTYKTEIHTITSCAPTVTNCPVGKETTIVTSEVVPATTTDQAEKPVPVTTQAPEAPALLTTYKTNIVTVTSCPPTVTNCPVGKESTIVTSEVITPTAPAPGVPAAPSQASQNPPAPGSENPSTPVAPGGENPATTPVVPGADTPATSPAAPGAGKPATTPVFPGAETPAATPVIPGAETPATTVVPQNPVVVPGSGPSTPSVPTAGQTNSAQEPVPEIPAPTASETMPTTLVVAPSTLYNGSLTTARFPVGTGAPCIGSSCPAATTGPVQAGAGKISSGTFVLAAALVVFFI